MSIAALLARQSLIHQKNNLQFQMMQNNQARYNMLQNISFNGSLEECAAQENSLDLENISNSSQLMAINAELEALSSSKLNYLA